MSKELPIAAVLTKKYSSALYSYFRVINLGQAYEDFIKSPAAAPKFKYSSAASAVSTRRRLKELASERSRSGLDERDMAFINWRVTEAKILDDFWRLKKSKRVSARQVSDYLAAQVELYGPLDEDLFAGIVRNIQKISVRRKSDFQKKAAQLEKMIGPYNGGRLFAPSPETFSYYQQLVNKSFPKLIKTLDKIREADDYDSSEIKAIFEEALAAVGADKKGWRVITSKEGGNIIVSKYRKRVIVGSHFQPLSTVRLKQVVMHEVGCHVQKAMTARTDWHYPRYNENDEGLAIILEQLLDKHFAHKRALRYLAVCLAVGLDGKKRNFQEVYEIMWRAAHIISGNPIDTAKKQGFYETARAFRGGLPSVRGAAFIKDKVYLEGNIKAWQELEAKHLSPAEFKALFIKKGIK